MNVFSHSAPTLPRRSAKVIYFPRPQTKQLLVPREHGSWGMWLLPLLSGAVVGFGSRQAGAPAAIFWFVVAASSAFLSYQPLEALLGASPVRARSDSEKRIAAGGVLLTGLAGALSASALIRLGRGRVLWFAGLALACFAVRFLFGRARGLRVPKQILGALGLSSAAAGAYYVVTEKIDATALLLWGASWLFAVGQIEYVQLRIRTATALSSAEKALAGWGVYVFHLAVLGVAIASAEAGLVPALLALAFLPTTVRLVIWIFSRPAKINFRALGFSELFHSLAFSALLVTALLLG